MGARRFAEYALIMALMGVIGAITLRWHVIAEKREVARLLRTLRRINP